MTDLMFSTGFTPQDKKVCSRCLRPNDNPLQMLCDECREGDELADLFGGTEITANALRARQNEIEQDLKDKTDKQHAAVLFDELAEIGIALDKLYLPVEQIADAKREASFGIPL